MYVIQNGPSWWVDQVSRFPGGQLESRGRVGAMGNTYEQNPLDTSDSSQSNNAFVSDFEDEGEAGAMGANDPLHGWVINNISAEIEAGQSSGGESNEDPAHQSFQESLKQNMLQDAAAAFAATSPGQDRSGLLSLLKH